MFIDSAYAAFVLAAIIERAQGLVQHNNVDQAQESARSPPSFKKTWPILSDRRELRGSAVRRLKVPEMGVVNTPDDVTIASRGLQGACGATEPIEVVSPALSDMEGCFYITDSATDTLYFSTNVASAVGIIESQGRTFWAAWYYKDGSPESTPTMVCYSSEDPDEVDATEVAAWICDLDENGTFEAVTSSEFSIECGCSSGTTTDGEDGIPAPAPTPPLGSDSCGDGDAFTIISDEFPETEGCYRDSGRTEEGESLYTLTGTPFLGQQMVYASVEDDTDAVFWVVSFAAQASSASMAETYCISAEEASSVHPSEVEAWGCVIDSVTTTATDADFRVVCGCSDSGTTEPETTTSTSFTTSTSSTTSSTTDITMIDETPAPVVPETPAPVVPETPSPVVPETPVPVDPETPVPVMPETPAPVVPETPSPVVPETPVTVDPETPVPVVPETPVPVVPETPSPVVPETPVPVVPETEAPVPVIPETEAPVPVVPETPAPVIDDADGSTTSSGTNPTCSNGLAGVESENGEICCVTACGTCGGAGCYSRAGLKGGQCCTRKISTEGELCDVAGQAPCIISIEERL